MLELCQIFSNYARCENGFNIIMLNNIIMQKKEEEA